MSQTAAEPAVPHLPLCELLGCCRETAAYKVTPWGKGDSVGPDAAVLGRQLLIRVTPWGKGDSVGPDALLPNLHAGR